MAWKKEEITLEDGRHVDAQVPEIVSASRSTDIPAFYADWFFERLKKGYSAWTNPFNGVKSYVSYKNTRFIVFWSKNPKPLLKHLDYLKERNINCYVQYTLNDYDDENLEPGVPAVAGRVETFKALSEKLGKEAVIWRFDPMILTDKISIDSLLKKVERLGDQLHEYTDKLVFSYADIESYKKVKRNLINGNIHYIDWNQDQMKDFANQLVELNKDKGWNLELATCGEEIDLEECGEEIDRKKYGIAHNRCIDGDLIVKIAWKDNKLMDFMKVKIEKVQEQTLDGKPIIPKDAIELPGNRYFKSVHKKDPGQRKFCGCMAAKDIGEYNTCPHLCEYCYANTSMKVAKLNYIMHKKNPHADTITGK